MENTPTQEIAGPVSDNPATAMSREQQQYQPLPGYATSTSTAHGEVTAPTRVLYVEKEGKTHRRTRVLDSNERTPLYNTEVRWSVPFASKPDTTIYNAETNVVVATLCFNIISGRIDINIHGQKIEFYQDKMLSVDHVFRSPTLQETLRWERDGKWYAGGLICLNEKEQPLAVYRPSKGVSLREEKIELGAGIEGALMDELVVCALALAELERRVTAWSIAVTNGIV